MEAFNEKPAQDSVLDELGDYAETNFKLLKYKAIDSSSSFIADIITDLILISCLLMLFFFASLTLAYYLAWRLDSVWEGFGCVTVLYILVAVIITFLKKGIERPIINAVVRKFFK